MRPTFENVCKVTANEVVHSDDFTSVTVLSKSLLHSSYFRRASSSEMPSGYMSTAF